ncbi:MAG: tetratricopeptide repeat protein [Acidobacteria bacterium]|nr:tetratricopeptide repeat protein [Acidobacteriota bacterium]
MKRNLLLCLLAASIAACPLAEAGTKEELVRLQSDVLALQNQIREFDKGYTEKLDSLRSLVIQLNDQAARSGLVLDRISAAMENTEAGTREADRNLLEEVRRLSEKVDEVGTRISAMAQQLGELKVQSASLGPATSPGLSPEVLYNQAFGDFVQGNFDLAIEGFSAYVSTYPAGEKAPDALLNIGDSHIGQNRLPQAVAAFTRVINDYAESAKVPSALYKRARVELAMQEKENATADLRHIVEKFPQSPEAGLAQAELDRLTASKPAAPARRKAR